MSTLYDIHGLTVRVDGLCRAAVPDINAKLHWFEIADDGRGADIEVRIGPFEPDRKGCLALDRRYWARPGYLYAEESDKGLSWRMDVEGLDRPAGRPLRIRFAHGKANRRRLPWRLFPDLVMHLYVLWPVLECESAARGLWLVHAGAVERDGRAVLIAGRGGVNKTALVAELCRRDWRPLSDDFVLLQHRPAQGTMVLPMPTSPRWFQFQLRHKEDEVLSLRDKLRLLRYLYHRRDVSVAFAAEASLDRVVLLQAMEGQEAPEAGPLPPAPAAEAVELNCRMERTAYLGHGFRIGRFLEAYRYVVPASAYGRQWDAGLRPFLTEALAGTRAFRVKTPRGYDARLGTVVEDLQ
ncbi:MAG: hypothetical protein R6X20_07170 [Phycisphaerae bacterium]